MLVAQRTQNPRDFFRQRERAGSTSGSTSGTALPAGPLGTRPGMWRDGGGGGTGVPGGCELTVPPQAPAAPSCGTSAA